jgi:hypothetical protein|tara:strand:- start:203 stop:619 length:417 start_codon:yes stop_codon:yes gene_type:complete
MKIKAIIFGATVATILSTPVLASQGNTSQGVPTLERGVSSTQILAQGQSKRFNINIEQATTLQVTSEHFPGIRSYGNRISAVLYNESGQRVAEASSPQGHFNLVHQLQPGNYQLEVTGRSGGGSNANDDNRYKLHVVY